MQKTLTLPNAITCLNLCAGIVAIILTIQGDLTGAVIAMLAGALADVLDGLVARAMKSASIIGKDLDSLADVVTFGALPALWAMQLLKPEDVSLMTFGWHWLGIVIAPASALRLAKFNHDTRQTVGFIGLPTPANAMFWAGMVLLAIDRPYNDAVFLLSDDKVWFATVLFFVFLSSWLLHAPFKLPSLKIRPGGINENKAVVVLVFLGGAMVLIFKHLALAPLVLAYLLQARRLRKH